MLWCKVQKNSLVYTTVRVVYMWWPDCSMVSPNPIFLNLLGLYDDAIHHGKKSSQIHFENEIRHIHVGILTVYTWW